MRFVHQIEREDFHAAGALIREVEVRDSNPQLQQRLEQLCHDLEAGRAGGDEAIRTAVRAILRNGRYRPSGRGKPAQEYLVRVYNDQKQLELINNVVDVNNAVSLRHGLPISAFDADKIDGEPLIRLGREGERYQFNASGQQLECHDLVVVCDRRGPIGSPVKDSQPTKVFAGATSILYVVYANAEVISADRLLAVARELSDLLVEDCPGARADPPQMFESLLTPA